MKRFLSVASLPLCALVVCAPLYAETLKITINGGTLNSPLEITDAKVRDFEVWSGLGFEQWSTDKDGKRTRVDNGEGFIGEWSKDAVSSLPAGIESYEVSFLVMYQGKPSPYIVRYAYDGPAQKGYVYLPKRSEPNGVLNTAMIVRGIEGKWLPATSKWNDFVRPIIERAKSGNPSPQ
jgi:hypothetical protein